MSESKIRYCLERLDSVEYEHLYKMKAVALQELDSLEAELRTVGEELEYEKQIKLELEADLETAQAENERLRKALESLLPGEDAVTGRSVESHLATGRIYLNVAGFVTAVEGDRCRDSFFVERYWTAEAIQEIEEKFNAPIREALNKK